MQILVNFNIVRQGRPDTILRFLLCRFLIWITNRLATSSGMKSILCLQLFGKLIKKNTHVAISHIHRNRTEKIKCLKPYERFHICAETETEPKPNAEPKTCTILILFFFGFGGRISANTTGNFYKICTYTTTCVVYNIIIIKVIDGLSSETIVRLFYKHTTIDYRLLRDNTQSDYKDHKLNAVTC